MILLMFVFTQQGRFEWKSIEIVFPILSISLDMIHPYQVAESRQYIIKRQLVVIDSYRDMTGPTNDKRNTYTSLMACLLYTSDAADEL